MSKHLVLILALAFPGCLAQVEEPASAPPAECAWTDETYSCDPALFTREVTELDAGGTFCWIYTYHCGDVVDTCKREVYSCQPQGAENRGGRL